MNGERGLGNAKLGFFGGKSDAESKSETVPTFIIQIGRAHV